MRLGSPFVDGGDSFAGKRAVGACVGVQIRVYSLISELSRFLRRTKLQKRALFNIHKAAQLLIKSYL